MDLNIEDFDTLRQFLSAHMLEVAPPSFKKLAGGVSNRTVLVTWQNGRAWVLKQALAKLRVREDWFSSPERIHVEAKALRWLNRLAPEGMIPAFLFEDRRYHLLAMEAVPEEHHNWKSMLLAGQAVYEHFEQFGFLLGTIHLKSYRAGEDLRRAFSDTTYFENLRLDPYYGYAASKVPIAAAFLTILRKETLRNKLSLVHGDFSPKNALLHENRLVLLDYEVVHFGDPAFDIGFALTHFLSKANHLPHHRTVFAEASMTFWKTYAKEIEPLQWEGLEARAVRHTLGCLLARVKGKSPLEYLSASEATRQERAAVGLIACTPLRIEDLIRDFIRQIEDED